MPYKNVDTDENIIQSDVESKTFPGQEVTIKPVEKENYEIDQIIIKDENGNIIDVNDNKFVMPNSNVNITVKYKYIYKILSGSNQTYSNKDLIIKTNGDLGNLESIKVNGKILEPSNYSLKSGSTILSLNKDYLSSLSNGTYDITFEYTDGSINTTFIIDNKKTNTTFKNPKTSDNIMIYIIMAIVGVIGILVFGFIIKRKMNK